MHRRAARVMIVFVLASCGSGDDGPAPDAAEGAIDAPQAPDAAALPDASVDARPPPDAAPPPIDAAPPPIDAALPRGDIEDFFDSEGRACAVDLDCANPLSHCRPIGLFVGSPMQCIPACADSDECPFGTVCYTDPVLVSMADHCYLSLCGEAFFNGVTGGPCQLGAEIGNPLDEQFPGWCFPFSDGVYGQCMEVGTVPEGGVCDYLTQTREGANCDAFSLCVGTPAEPSGTCARQCDPTAILTATPTGCDAGQACLDVSRHYGSDPAQLRGTIGYCVAGETACSTIAANTCPDDPATGEAQGCGPTNPLRPTGLCDPASSGAVATGGGCDPVGTTDATQCVPGGFCRDAAAPTCEQICDLGTAPTVECAFGTCTALVWDAGNPIDPGDDGYTADWGTCL